LAKLRAIYIVSRHISRPLGASLAPTAEQEGSLSASQYGAIASFRYELRRFLAFSEAAANACGLPPQQHQALLAVAGHAESEPPSVGTIADQLLVAPHTAAELVSRMADAGLLTKTPSREDRRRMELHLTAKSELLLRHLTVAHLDELKTLEPALLRALGRLKAPQA
jgi:DNA-binding MarR family transcriptional regulator